MDELQELRVRLNNNLLASDWSPEDFAQRAGIGAAAVKRFLLGPSARKTHAPILTAITKTMRNLEWLPPVEPVPVEAPQLTLELPAEPVPEPKKELTRVQKRFLTYAIYAGHNFTLDAKDALLDALGL